ncbi:[citrate (pro-3S)-lyase] ligase [Acidaminobacterium chupaoyuni]
MEGSFVWEFYEKPFGGAVRRRLERFLAAQGLAYDEQIEKTAVCYDGEGQIAATGSLDGSTLKCIAVAEEYRGMGLTAAVMTQLQSAAFAAGQHHLFLFTKPKNEEMFAPFGFYPIAATEEMLLMENKKNGIADFVNGLQKGSGLQGCVVANCNPFTLGHRALVEVAAKACDTLHLFILSEDKSLFPSAVRMELAKAGTADLPNVLVHPTSDYLISSATFPTYFLKEQQILSGAGGALDLEIFCRWFAPALGITRRFMGQEPYCPVTARYNEQMKQILPRHGIEAVEIRRKEESGSAISASRVRALMAQGRVEEIRPLVPQTTWDFLQTSQGRQLIEKAAAAEK